jgi:serine O-acetyltransferase
VPEDVSVVYGLFCYQLYLTATTQVITSKEDYIKYLYEDRMANGDIKSSFLTSLKSLFIYSEPPHIMRYLKILRKLEYLTNTNGGLIKKISYWITRYRYNRICHKLNIGVPINTIGYGLRLPHIGDIGLGHDTKLGNHCTLQTGVMIGPTSGRGPRVGDHVYFAPGAKVFGSMKIGNHVVVAPNSVVVKDIPDNCVVSGVPAKIIKMNGEKVS